MRLSAKLYNPGRNVRRDVFRACSFLLLTFDPPYELHIRERRTAPYLHLAIRQHPPPAYRLCAAGCHGYAPLSLWFAQQQRKLQVHLRGCDGCDGGPRLEWRGLAGPHAQRINLLGTDRLKLDPRRQSRTESMEGGWLDDVVDDDWGNVGKSAED
jgi:hypothetical protein